MEHANAPNLKEVFEKIPDELSKPQLLQISMGEPSVNWSKFYSKVETSLRNDLGFSLINLGRYGLPTIHNAFQN